MLMAPDDASTSVKKRPAPANNNEVTQVFGLATGVRWPGTMRVHYGAASSRTFCPRRMAAFGGLCSLMGQGRRLGGERYRRCRVSAFSTCSWALDWISWVRSGLVEVAVGLDRMLQNPRRHLLPPSGVAPLGSSVRPPVWLRRVELCAVSQHGVHDDGETTGERDPGLTHGGSFGD